MKINYTKIYRLWFLLTTISVFGALTVYFIGYKPQGHIWVSSYHNMYILFIGMLLAAVLTRIYMAIGKINPVPLMHLIRANSFLSALMALGYIVMCSLLLITLLSELYFIMTPQEQQILGVYTLRDMSQPIFAIAIAIHVILVLVVNITKRRDSLRKLIYAMDSQV